MGRAAERRAAFFAQHPICCFCGGEAKATTEDHIPARSIFDGRQWPEGYVFPACVNCNDATRRDEQIIAMLSRVMPDATTPAQQDDARRAIRGVINNWPDLARKLIPTQDKVQSFLEKRGMYVRPGALGRVPLLDVDHPEIHDAIKRYGCKLACALHYKHHGRILPRTGGVHIKWYSNVQVLDGRLPRELSDLLKTGPQLTRSTRVLNDQFGYDWNADDEGKIGLYLCQFRQSFAIVIFVFADVKAAVDKGWEGDLLTPFNHNPLPLDYVHP